MELWGFCITAACNCDCMVNITWIHLANDTKRILLQHWGAFGKPYHGLGCNVAALCVEVEYAPPPSSSLFLLTSTAIYCVSSRTSEPAASCTVPVKVWFVAPMSGYTPPSATPSVPHPTPIHFLSTGRLSRPTPSRAPPTCGVAWPCGSVWRFIASSLFIPAHILLIADSESERLFHICIQLPLTDQFTSCW